ncbi:MAG: glycosyltransferase family 2 protein [Armatimonadaceae bacterium]
MQFVIPLFGGLLAAAWSGIAAEYTRGVRQGKSLRQQQPYPKPSPAGGVPAEVPSLSVLIAACNEEEKLPTAFRSLLAQEYPGSFEIVVVNDRSTDRTGAILDALTAEAQESHPDKNVLVLHNRHLPTGWLGKTHAQYQAAKRANGEWLLFTDADIVFEETALSRAVRFAETEKVDHLVTFMNLDLRGFWENVFGLGFSFLFFMRFRPWQVRNPKSSAYLGVGGFNLVRRYAYDGMGTHRAIALEVADDMELGRQLKRNGYVSEVVDADGLISVRWQEGLDGLMGGLVKNAYAGLNYSPLQVVSATGQLLAGIWVPIMGTILAKGKARTGYGIATAILLGLASFHARAGKIPPAYGLTLPISTLLLIVVMWRSMFVTEKNGGITWRGTFYPLETLRERAIPAEPTAEQANHL